MSLLGSSLLFIRSFSRVVGRQVLCAPPPPPGAGAAEEGLTMGGDRLDVVLCVRRFGVTGLPVKLPLPSVPLLPVLLVDAVLAKEVREVGLGPLGTWNVTPLL